MIDPTCLARTHDPRTVLRHDNAGSELQFGTIAAADCFNRDSWVAEQGLPAFTALHARLNWSTLDCPVVPDFGSSIVLALMENRMAFTEWMIRGPEIASCNCSYGCPCQFNALPTNGSCRAAVGMQIEEGHYGNVSLDGLRWAAIGAWPEAIHMGHGEIQPIVDERATPEQREALLKIMSGQDTEPGATFFNVFVSMCDKVHEPLFKAIDFSVDMKSCEGHISVPGVLDVKTQAIRNPVTGNAHHARVSLRQGFEFLDAEFASSTIKSKGAIELDSKNGHAHLASLHLTGQGIVHPKGP